VVPPHYAYYGNTISTPQIIASSPARVPDGDDRHELAIFPSPLCPGLRPRDRADGPDRTIAGCSSSASSMAPLAVIGLVPGMTTAVVPFLLA